MTPPPPFSKCKLSDKKKNVGVPKLCLKLSEFNNIHFCVKEIYFEASFHCLHTFGVDPLPPFRKTLEKLQFNPVSEQEPG